MSVPAGYTYREFRNFREVDFTHGKVHNQRRDYFADREQRAIWSHLSVAVQLKNKFISVRIKINMKCHYINSTNIKINIMDGIFNVFCLSNGIRFMLFRLWLISLLQREKCAIIVRSLKQIS